MRICVLNHHGKADLLIEALHGQGFDLAAPGQILPDGRLRAIFDFEVLLLDSDSPHAVPAWKHPFARACADRGIPLVLYPHGAPPQLDYGGIRPFHLPVSLLLVHGEGHAEIYRRIGLRVPTRVVGWSYCEMAASAADAGDEQPATPVGRAHSSGGGRDGRSHIQSLLFAPIHPWADGKTIMPAYQHANEQAYQAFLAHPAPVKTARVWGALEAAGIYERSPDVTYTDTSFPMVVEIDAHDAVVSFGTFAYLALARGKPTVIYGQEIPPMNDEHTVVAAHWNDYRDYLRYPVDTLDKLGTDVAEWKRLFVGEPLDAEALAAAVRFVRPNRATRRRLAHA